MSDSFESRGWHLTNEVPQNEKPYTEGTILCGGRNITEGRLPSTYTQNIF
jgi:hypothetical protein